MNSNNLPIIIADEVREAVASNRPVVSLESTIISHGMSYPFNVELAEELESIVRGKGAVPATTAIIDGIIRVGLTEKQIELIGTDRTVRKTSKREIPIIAAEKGHGSTTVAATMFCASLAGIKVFVTGGIGGVHRDAQQTFDISSDLTELSETSVAVVCAGAKSILDIGLTLEKLETLNVPVIGYQTDDFPAFYSRESGFGVDYNADSAEKIAGIMKTKWDLGMKGGLVIACPIPEEDEIPAEEMDEFIKKALKEAEKESIRGKYVTPFMLQEIHTQTRGRSIKANMSLIKNNAEIGTEIAKAYCSMLEQKKD